MQSRVDAGSAPAGHRFPLVYLASWALAGMLSLAYLAQVALTGGKPAVQEALNGAVQTPQVTAAAEARAARLKATLEDFQRDIAVLRSTAQGQGIDPSTEARLAALEERMAIETGVPVTRLAAADQPSRPAPATRVAGAIAHQADGHTRLEIPLETGSIEQSDATPSPSGPAGPVAPAAAAAPPAAAALSPAPSASGAPAHAATPAATPVPPAKLARTAPPAPKVVAAVAPPVKTAPPAAPTAADGTPLPAGFAPVVTPAQPPPKPFAVHIASATTRNDLRDSWVLLESEHADTLRNLSPRVAQSLATPEAGPVYDLLAGPFRSASDAKKACKALAARGVDCKVGSFIGDAL